MRRLRWVLLVCLACAVFTSVSAQVGDHAFCPPDFAGYLPPRLGVGIVGDIRPDGVPNRVRAEPSRSAAFLFQIEPGTAYTVIGGPTCSDGIVWWRVDYNGRVGWTAESSAVDRVYYLQRAASGVTRRAFAGSDRPRISHDQLGSLRLLDTSRLLPGRFAAAPYANLLAVLPAGGRFTLFNTAVPSEPLAEIVPEGVPQFVAVSPAGLRLALGLLEPEAQTYRAAIYRYDPTFVTPLEPLSVAIDLSQELPLAALALSQPYLLTGHGILGAGDDDDRGALIIWDSETGEEQGRVELPFVPTEIVIDSSGAAAFVSTRGGDAAETLLIDIETSAVIAAVPEHGPLGLAPASGLEISRLLIGGLDGRVAVYNLLRSERTDDLRSFRLERLGSVEVFVGLPNLRVSVTALAVDPTGHMAAVGSGVYVDDALPEDYASATAFIDLRTGLVSASSLRDPTWGMVYGLAFSADGTALIVGASNRDGVPLVMAFGIPE